LEEEMKNNYSVFKSMIILFALFVFLIGCSKNNNVEEHSTSDNSVTIWAWDSGIIAAEKAIEIYKKHNPDTHYEFELIKMGQDDMVEKIKLYLASGSLDVLPDIFYDEDYNAFEYITYYNDYFFDLSSYIEPNDYMEYKMINITHDNKIYAIPYDDGIGALFYRIDIINKAGFNEEDMRQLTWDKFIEIGKQVRKVSGIDMVVLVPEGDMEGRLMYQSAGTWFFDENGKANILNNQAFETAFLTLKKAIDSGCVYSASSWDDIISAVSNGKVASLIGASWWIPIIWENKSQNGLWRITEMPRMNGENYTNYSNLGGRNWFVLNKKNKIASTEFAIATFGESLELANYMAKMAAYIPVNKNLTDKITDEENDFFGGQKITSILSEFGKHIIPVKYGLHTYEITYTVGNFASDYIKGKSTLEEAIIKMQREAERISEN
jgi:lactose/L-arabinose transport system substrate-binding protein